MQLHPFVQDNAMGTKFPSQNIPLSKKTDKWKRANMDAAEAIARVQFEAKRGIINNYRLINGELIESEYSKIEGESENFDVLEYASEKLSLPGFVKNYDIIGQPIRTLEGEMDSFPDVFIVKGYGDIFTSERENKKSELLMQWYMTQVMQTINDKLGYPDGAPEFEDQQQQQQYQQQVQSLTPPEIETYMKTSYRHIIEDWGQHEMQDQFERYNIKSLRRKEFHHYLVAGERYRHLKTNNKGLYLESLNPLYVFSKKSPNSEFVQDGHLAGVIELMDVTEVIDTLGHRMTDKQLNSLERPYESTSDMDYGKHLDGSPIKFLSPYGVPYQTRVPFLDPRMNNYFPDMMNNGAGGLHEFMTEAELSKIDGSSGKSGLENLTTNMMVVVTAYWKSQRRVGKLTTLDMETGFPVETIVDETYVVPDYIKQIRNEVRTYDAGIDTLIWSRETQIWQGIKITNYNSDGLMREPIYLDIQPADIQIDKLPIAGQFANNINTRPTSLVDRLKPWQFFFNILINQCYHYFETELAPFMVLSADMIPNSKDWGGEEGLQKWLDIARTGAVIADTSPIAGGQNLGGQYPKIMDLDVANRIMSRLNLAIQIKQLALEQVGISPQRLGEVTPQQTTGGVQQAVQASYTQTSGWFTTFFDCEKNILQMQLDAAKFLQSRNKEFSVQVLKTNLTMEALRFAEEDGDLYDLHLYITDSQKELRSLELARQLALNNNTSDIPMSDRIEMATNSSVREIVAKLKVSEERGLQMRQQELQNQQAQLEQQGKSVEEAQQLANQQFYAKLENDYNIAILRALGNSRDEDMANGEVDILEVAKMHNTVTATSNQNQQAQAKLSFERDKSDAQIQLERERIRNEREQRISDQVLANKKIKQATIAGDKSK